MSNNFLLAPMSGYGRTDAAQAAPHVWEALGDVNHYIEAFAGNLSVLLSRPHTSNRRYHEETANDFDCLIVNTWRSIKYHPAEVFDNLEWIPSDAEVMARTCYLQKWRDNECRLRIQGDPMWCDPLMGAWYIYCVNFSFNLGRDLVDGGPWWPDWEGKIRKLNKEERSPGKGVSGSRINDNQLLITSLRDREKAKIWLERLSNRLRFVSLHRKEWNKTLSKGTLSTIKTRTKEDAYVGILLDPPIHEVFKNTEPLRRLVREWCIENGDDKKLRIALIGNTYEDSELESVGWKSIEFIKNGSSGYHNTSDKTRAKGKEKRSKQRLWLSPHCVRKQNRRMKGLWV